MAEGPEASSADVTVWVYDDPASGIEVDEVPSIGTRLNMPRDLLVRFDQAREDLWAVETEVRDLLWQATAPSRLAEPTTKDGQ